MAAQAAIANWQKLLNNSLASRLDFEPFTEQDGNMQNGANNDANKAKRVKEGNKRWKNSYSAEEMMLYRLAKTVSTGARPKNVQEAVDLLVVSIQWMDMVAVGMRGGAHEILDVEAHVEEIGMILKVLENGTGIELGKAMAGFVPLLLQSSPQNAQRLDAFRTQTLITILPVNKKEQAANAEINDILDSTMGMNIDNIVIADLPAVNSRAGLYIYLNSLQCLSDSERVEGLISELENMDGNAGAVSQAIAEVIKHMCGNKETMTLKSLCSQLARNPSSLDIMLLFNKPTSFLQPICELLDNWRYDEDQGEYQPVYEEFGSILLLVISFTHRYNLSTVDLGIKNPAESFVAKLLVQGHLSRAFDPLSQQDQNHLDGWIRGLFEPEGGGLGDELMSSCPPQEFYLLVPTLFHHIVLALSTDTLSEEGLKGGLEFMVEPFLLPSLIPGITWLSAHLWEARHQATYILQILSALIKNPPSISNNMEASHLLNSILKIVAKNLEQSLRWLQRAEPQRQDIEPISKALESNIGWERRGASKHSELESWTATPGGGMSASIKHTIAILVQWGLQWARNPGMHIMPASYTHRQILSGLKMLGAKRLLNIIIDEVKAQTEAGNGSVALDIATSLVCAPDPTSFDSGRGMDILSGNTPHPLQRRLTLKEALKAEAENMPKVHKTDTFHAETVIRLYRRVEAQSAIQQQLLPHEDGLNALNEVMGDAVMGDAVMGDAGLGPADQTNLNIDDMGAGGEELMMMGGSGHGGDLLDAFGGDDLGDGMGF
ncbi:hypothetical protein SS1G_00679 [Sclerotinia sclerotiorum 1980 UF-70]|uniref:Mediator of RNA polymerase II transcription subunit 5 n=1 Tax=Sclerotinia sclerotiorum (strain ATCC 18683 / 1980 / Ss-1) TaxID=665079 RepID=A7E5V4_SCLS1|nr:hypothetical protein SS1G_00679 [Sclerotinia sclerotiorum 1980 UF-70]EDN91276.1 hypothetical protein SS1G_00679 [Sclerotinia sclerotiorum 1980 UF-70]